MVGFGEPGGIEKKVFRARKLFDGGFYNRSLQVLDQVEQKGKQLSENEGTELYYRRGRNQQAKAEMSSAQQSYAACVSRTPGQALWMKVYACYYLGQISEQNNQLDQARLHYAKALTFDDYDYQSGLEQRTKAALERLDGEMP